LCYAAGIFLTNLFDQLAKLKGDEREDLKVLATGVAAALAARKVSSTIIPIIVFPSPVGDIYLCTICTSAMLSIVQSSWLSEEEFGMGHIDLKPATARSVLGKWNL
jgi:THO complex subunit 2